MIKEEEYESRLYAIRIAGIKKKKKIYYQQNILRIKEQAKERHQQKALKRRELDKLKSKLDGYYKSIIFS